MKTFLHAAAGRGAMVLAVMALGGCAVYDPTPAYYAGDAPVYVQPGPVYVAPPPVYVPPPVYFNFGFRRGWGHHGYPRYGWHGGYPHGRGHYWHR